MSLIGLNKVKSKRQIKKVKRRRVVLFLIHFNNNSDLFGNNNNQNLELQFSNDTSGGFSNKQN